MSEITKQNYLKNGSAISDSDLICNHLILQEIPMFLSHFRYQRLPEILLLEYNMENINEYIVNTEWYPSNIVVMASLSVSTPGRSDKPSELRPYLELKKSKPRNCQRVVSF